MSENSAPTTDAALLNRCLNALALELPASVHEHATGIIRAHVARLMVDLAGEREAHDDCARGFALYQRAAEAREDQLRAALTQAEQERDRLRTFDAAASELAAIATLLSDRDEAGTYAKVEGLLAKVDALERRGNGTGAA